MDFRITSITITIAIIFASPIILRCFYRTQVSLVRSLCPDVRPSVSPRRCVDLTDVILADEDTNSILTDNANRAIQGNVAMHVTQPGGKTNASGAIWWPKLM